MSSTIACKAAKPVLHCRLIESGSYREQLTITPLANQPGGFDVRVASWLDNARQPLGHHVRYRTTLDHAALARLHEALGALLSQDSGGGPCQAP